MFYILFISFISFSVLKVALQSKSRELSTELHDSREQVHELVCVQNNGVAAVSINDLNAKLAERVEDNIYLFLRQLHSDHAVSNRSRRSNSLEDSGGLRTLLMSDEVRQTTLRLRNRRNCSGSEDYGLPLNRRENTLGDGSTRNIRDLEGDLDFVFGILDDFGRLVGLSSLDDFGRLVGLSSLDDFGRLLESVGHLGETRERLVISKTNLVDVGGGLLHSHSSPVLRNDDVTGVRKHTMLNIAVVAELAQVHLLHGVEESAVRVSAAKSGSSALAHLGPVKIGELITLNKLSDLLVVRVSETSTLVVEGVLLHVARMEQRTHVHRVRVLGSEIPALVSGETHLQVELLIAVGKPTLVPIAYKPVKGVHAHLGLVGGHILAGCRIS